MPLDGFADELEGLQRYPLPPDVRYVIDHLLDEYTLDEGTYIALNMFMPRKPLLDIIDEAGGERIPAVKVSKRYRLATNLIELVNAHIAEWPQRVRRGIAFQSVAWLRRDLDGLAKVYADWAFEDATTGGAMEAFLQRTRIRSNGEVWPRTARRLHSADFINRYVKRAEDSQQRRVVATLLLDRVELAGGMAVGLTDYSSMLAIQRDAARRAASQALEFGMHFKPNIKLRDLRKARRHRRAVLKRSLRIAQSVLAPHQVRGFVQGNPIIIPGQSFDLALTSAHSLHAAGHGALDVHVCNCISGEVLATLCTYIENTPVLDQVAAFSLAMRAGEEAQIIDDANIIKLTDEGRQHPLLAARATKHFAAHIANPENWMTIGPRDRWSRQEQRRRAQEYWEQTGRIWRDRLDVFTCGRRSKMVSLEEVFA